MAARLVAPMSRLVERSALCRIAGPLAHAPARRTSPGGFASAPKHRILGAGTRERSTWAPLPDRESLFGRRPGHRTFQSRRQSTAVDPGASSDGGSGRSDGSSFARSLVNLFPIVTFCLGAWQVYRLQWKLALIEDREGKLHSPAVEIPDDLDASTLAKYEFLRVKLSGTFLHQQEIHVGPRSRGDGDVGYFIVTPFVISGGPRDGQKILVNRGFVPRALRNAPLRPESLPKGVVTIEGLVRRGEQNSMGLLAKADPAKNMWTWMDQETMTATTGASPDFLIEMVEGKINKPFRLPEPRPPRVDYRNNHLQYAITWFGLSAASAAMLVAGRGRGGSLRRRSLPMR
ncbi:SURF1 family-domain-containing protein [Hyaloraphidium curvatum]|nr:SURF1 family-domain-containing protein [Hyaloraphidium curvatum]